MQLNQSRILAKVVKILESDSSVHHQQSATFDRNRIFKNENPSSIPYFTHASNHIITNEVRDKNFNNKWLPPASLFHNYCHSHSNDNFDEDVGHTTLVEGDSHSSSSKNVDCYQNNINCHNVSYFSEDEGQGNNEKDENFENQADNSFQCQDLVGKKRKLVLCSSSSSSLPSSPSSSLPPISPVFETRSNSYLNSIGPHPSSPPRQQSQAEQRVVVYNGTDTKGDILGTASSTSPQIKRRRRFLVKKSHRVK